MSSDPSKAAKAAAFAWSGTAIRAFASTYANVFDDGCGQSYCHRVPANRTKQRMTRIAFMPRPVLRGRVLYVSGIALTACINASQSSGGLPVSSILANTA